MPRLVRAFGSSCLARDAAGTAPSSFPSWLGAQASSRVATPLTKPLPGAAQRNGYAVPLLTPETEVTTLPNGVRIVSEASTVRRRARAAPLLSHRRSGVCLLAGLGRAAWHSLRVAYRRPQGPVSSLGVYVNSGSIYETADTAGGLLPLAPVPAVAQAVAEGCQSSPSSGAIFVAAAPQVTAPIIGTVTPPHTHTTTTTTTITKTSRRVCAARVPGLQGHQAPRPAAADEGGALAQGSWRPRWRRRRTSSGGLEQVWHPHAPHAHASKQTHASIYTQANTHTHKQTHTHNHAMPGGAHRRQHHGQRVAGADVLHDRLPRRPRAAGARDTVGRGAQPRARRGRGRGADKRRERCDHTGCELCSHGPVHTPTRRAPLRGRRCWPSCRACWRRAAAARTM